MNKLLNATNDQKVLDFLLDDPGGQYLAAEIEKATGISKGGINLALRGLAENGLVHRRKRGKFFLCSIDHTNPLCRQLKVVKTIQLLMPLIKKVSGKAERIILFGSAARGENTRESDIDLLIVSRNLPGEVEDIVQRLKLPGKLQLIIRDPVAFAEMERRDPGFFAEVDRGITLWERGE